MILSYQAAFCDYLALLNRLLDLELPIEDFGGLLNALSNGRVLVIDDRTPKRVVSLLSPDAYGRVRL